MVESTVGVQGEHLLNVPLSIQCSAVQTRGCGDCIVCGLVCPVGKVEGVKNGQHTGLYVFSN